MHMKLKDTNGVDRITSDLKYFCKTIGTRLAGSPEEKHAAEYTAGRFKELGLENVRLLPFPCKRWLPGGGKLEILDPARRTVDIQVVTHTPSTPAKGVEGELAIFEPVDWEKGIRSKDLQGKIGLFHGGYGESAAVYRQLHDSPLKALMFVDTRMQTDWPIANGMGEKFMTYTRKPMACLSLMDAWALARGGVKRVRLFTSGEIRQSTAYNVSGELPGAVPARAGESVIILSGHIDSVAVGVGADDNATGMAAIIECARRLRTMSRRHRIRFIGFAAEEQLSAGSTHYVKDQVRDLDRVSFVCNFDAVGAWLGLSEVGCTGTPAMDKYITRIIDTKLGFARVLTLACPYQDQFWFGARGIPGILFTRKTHIHYYWYHHSVHNNLENCSPVQVAAAAEAACEIIGDLAGRRKWPFPRRVSPQLQRQIKFYVRELF